jgi:hypothetical protein
VQRLCPEPWQQKNWLIHHDNSPSNNYFFTREFLSKNNMTVIPHPPHFHLFSRLKIKLKRRHFDTIEMIGAELQAVNYTVAEYDY